MKLWRKTRDEQGNSRLTEVTALDQIDTSKPVVFVFPTTESRNGSPMCAHRAAGAVKCVNNILKQEEKNPTAEVLVVTYDESVSHLKRMKMNKQMDRAKDRDAEAFVKSYLHPLVEQNASISLFGISYGSIFAEAVRASYIRHAREQGKEDNGIRNELGNIYAVTIANISRATTPRAKGRDGTLDYSSISFSFANDLTARVNNPGFRKSIPAGHTRDNITIAPLSGNRLHVIGNAPRQMSQWKKSEEGMELEVVRNTSRIPGLRTNHVPQFFLMTGGDGGLYPLVERALHNAVNRQGSPSVQSLMEKEVDRKQTAPSHSEANLPSWADRLRISAHQPQGSWEEHVRPGRIAGLERGGQGVGHSC